jgi:hypothetical protein
VSRIDKTGSGLEMPSENRKSRKTDQRSNIHLRPLTEEEVKRLERALGKPIDRKRLVHWVEQATRDVVRLWNEPTLRDCRDGFSRIAREGRRWLQHIECCPGELILQQNTELDQLMATVSGFCENTEAVAKRLSAAIHPGHARTPFVKEAFLDRMIGIAKMARVLPSTPGRATKPTLPPAFFAFTKKALAIARDVIESSPVPEDQKKAALLSLLVQSDEALIKVLERLRGKIGNYQESEHGLVEWETIEFPDGEA